MLNMSDKLDGMKVSRSAKCRNTSPDSISLNFTIDYTGLTIKDVLNRAVRQDVIDGQKVWEKMTPAELMEKVNGKTLLASSIGTKVKSESEIMAEGKAHYDSLDEEGKVKWIKDMTSRANES